MKKMISNLFNYKRIELSSLSHIDVEYNSKLFEACLTNKIRANNNEINEKFQFQSNCFSMWNLCLYGACLNGDKEIIDFVISKGANNWDWGLHGACYGGHMDVVERMLRCGATDYINGCVLACLGKQRPVADRMIKCGIRKPQIYDITFKKK
jgi:hypothetical protein